MQYVLVPMALRPVVSDGLLTALASILLLQEIRSPSPGPFPPCVMPHNDEGFLTASPSFRFILAAFRTWYDGPVHNTASGSKKHCLSGHRFGRLRAATGTDLSEPVAAA